MFSGAHHIVAKDNQFIDISFSGPTGIDILLQASAPEAAHDSGSRAYAPRCFPGTRNQYIEDILQWALPTAHDSSLPLYWMKGAAGVGKSAIAQTSAEKMKKSGILGGAFFFTINGTNKPTTFFPSIAYQLSVKSDDYRELINKKILRDKTLVSKSALSQFQGLIIEPLIELERQGKGIGKRIVIVVDGFDECDGVDAQCEIIEIVAASARDSVTTPLCWAFFSRPEPHIEATFSQRDIGNLCHKMTLPVSNDADSDIELYLRSSFDNILQRRNISTESQWPSDRDLKVIVKAAGGLFIYAATVTRFVAQPEWISLDEPLGAVLAVIAEVDRQSLTSSIPLSPFAELDAFYLLIMRRVPKQMLPSIRLLLGYLSLPGISNVAITLANLLMFSKTKIHALCSQLNAVLKHDVGRVDTSLNHEWDADRAFYDTVNSKVLSEFPDLFHTIPYNVSGTISSHHKSFNDFLVDPLRSGEFCVKSSGDYELLFEKLWRVRLDYVESYCFRNSELVLASGIPDSGFSLSYPYQNEFINSVVKVWVYNETVYFCDWLAFEVGLSSGARRKLATSDFRKELHITALWIPNPRVVSTVIYRQPCLVKYVDGVRLVRSGSSQRDELGRDDFVSLVAKLGKLTTHTVKDIEDKQQAGIIRPYSRPRNLSSMIKLLFRGKSQGKIESRLYLMGHGSKAIFWRWEIDHNKRSYREFRAVNLAEGEKIYRAEDFDSWSDKTLPDHG